MMNEYDEILGQSLDQLEGALIVTDEKWNILHKTGTVSAIDEHWAKWSKRFMDDPTDDLNIEWEIADKEDDVYFRVYSKSVKHDGRSFLIHQLFDVSDYGHIFQDLSSYSRMWRTLNTCQSDLMKVLAEPLTQCLPIVVKHIQAECAVLYVQRQIGLESGLKRYVFIKGSDKVIKKRFPDHRLDSFAEEHTSGTICRLPGFYGDFICFTNATAISGDSYALYVSIPEKDKNDRMYPMYFSMFRLYIENALLREKVVYESEHDNLTGLYNKMKYSNLMAGPFRECESITIFNLDVNYLKRINDTKGHEAGNNLLRKASSSLKAVSGENTYAFRLGGDEFMLIAMNADETKAKDLEKRWREALAGINAADPSVECVIACGRVTGTAPYDIDALLEQADKLMYADKRAIKIARGDDPDAR